MVLVSYGNHIRGSLFLDNTYKNTTQLEALIDRVCKSVDSFYYGRLAIRFNSFEELVADKNCRIIEINGAGSEPAHMYDPNIHCYLPGKKLSGTGKCFMKFLYRIRKGGFLFLSYSEGKKMLSENGRYIYRLDEIKLEKTKIKSSLIVEFKLEFKPL